MSHVRPIALVRSVPASFADCIVAHAHPDGIDVALARKQHLGYRAALATYGFEVHSLPPDDALPDSVFVEDTVVVVDGVALVTRPGAVTRLAEVEAPARFVADHLPVERMEDPGTLDGGDVLEVGRRFFVGRSARTNDAGIARLRTLAAAHGRDVMVVEVESVLHLKTAVTAIDDTTLLVARGAFDLAAFAGFDLVEVPHDERPAANALRLGKGRVLVADGYPETARRIAATGAEVVTVDVSEFTKADGGLTCLSVLLPRPS